MRNSQLTQPFDVVGVGLNATDTIALDDRFPAYAGKARIRDQAVAPGGQVASAMAACARLGLRAKYIGALGDDEPGRLQLRSLTEAGVDVSEVRVRSGYTTQSGYIVVDASTGERTIFWSRDDRLAIDPADITEESVLCARLLHIAGHDTAAVARAASIARAHGMPVAVDVDTIYPGFDRVLPHVDYLLASLEFPSAWTGIADPFDALAKIQNEYGMKLAGMTLGANGSLARYEGRFVYAPAFEVEVLDTTGAGDVFHGGFCYAVLQGMPVLDALEFSNAMAALNCGALGARGGLRGLDEIRALMRNGKRRSHPDFAARAARE